MFSRCDKLAIIIIESNGFACDASP